MHCNMRPLPLIVPIMSLFLFMGCASTPPPQLSPDELKMLADIQRERGDLNAQRTSKILGEIKRIQKKSGRQKALEYLMRIGTRYPYEAREIAQTLFGEHVPPGFNDELKMLADIQRERGEANAGIALRFLQEAKHIQKKAGSQKALEYLMRIGPRFPYEAVKIREILFGSHAPTEFDRELNMLADIQRERGEAHAQIAFRFLQQAKLIQRKSGRQKAMEYLMRIGTRYPYEALKIRETLFGEHLIAHADRAAEETPPSSREQVSAPDKPAIPPSSPGHVEQKQEAEAEYPPGPAYGRKFALVIGISNYKNHSEDGLPNLLYADDDAHDFSEALKKLGWRSSHIKTLINERATKRNIEIALESWLTKAGQDDLIALFWSGHGFVDPEDPEKVYFACYDTNISIPATGYRMDRVRQSLEERGARNVLFFADTCHAGKMITRGNRGISVVPHLQKLQREKDIPKGWIFMVGAQTDRQAVENSSWSNGAFTHCLLEGMLGKADGFQSIGPEDGRTTMGELQAYLSTAMPDETQKVLGIAKRPVIATTTGDPSIWDLSLSD